MSDNDDVKTISPPFASEKPAALPKRWKCNVCGAVLENIDWTRATKGQTYHTTPTGGECRAVNLTAVVGEELTPQKPEHSGGMS